jgi:hypothetical protein
MVAGQKWWMLIQSETWEFLTMEDPNTMGFNTKNGFIEL